MVDTKTGFVPPDEETRKKAIGNFENIPIQDQVALQILEQNTKQIPVPQKGDWLAQQNDKPQSYELYTSKKRKIESKNQKFIYIVSLDPKISLNFLKNLQIVCEAFYYNLKVKILQRDISSWNVKSRINDGNKQYYVWDILKCLEQTKPADAYCYTAVLMTDLYPYESWNFCFGWATYGTKVGAFSFARYDDRFFNENAVSNPEKIQFLACKIMVHEIGHQFAMWHCIYNDCLMNGCNGEWELEKQKFRFCPICEHKLHTALEFDILQRYIRIMEVCNKIGGQLFMQEVEAWRDLINKIELNIKPLKNKQEEQKEENQAQNTKISKFNQKNNIKFEENKQEEIKAPKKIEININKNLKKNSKK